jgi:hypothetical protein
MVPVMSQVGARRSATQSRSQEKMERVLRATAALLDEIMVTGLVDLDGRWDAVGFSLAGPDWRARVAAGTTTRWPPTWRPAPPLPDPTRRTFRWGSSPRWSQTPTTGDDR